MAIEMIKKNYEFRRLYAKGKSASTYRLVLCCRPNGRPYNRFGISISTKVGKAVVRNKQRRRLKEIFRNYGSLLKPGYDIVVSVRVRGGDAALEELKSDFFYLADKLSISKSRPDPADLS